MCVREVMCPPSRGPTTQDPGISVDGDDGGALSWRPREGGGGGVQALQPRRLTIRLVSHADLTTWLAGTPSLAYRCPC